LLENFKEKIRPYLESNKIMKEKEKDIRDEINEAHQKWLNARRYFDNVSEPELIDHASYLLQATRTKYMYLLNKFKENQGQLLKKEEENV